MREEFFAFSDDVLESTAKEMLDVGIVPSMFPRPKGYQFRIGTQPVVVTGDATKDEFLESARAAGLHFHNVSENFFFLRITSD